MANMFVVRASARLPGTRYGLKAALQTPHFIRLKCYALFNILSPLSRMKPGVRSATFRLCSVPPESEALTRRHGIAQGD